MCHRLGARGAPLVCQVAARMDSPRHRCCRRAVRAPSTRWTVAFDGRSLGTIRTIGGDDLTEAEWSYPRDHRITLDPASVVPAVRNAEQRFGGQCSVPVNRPLVLVAPPNVSDPDRWTPVTLGSSNVHRLFVDFTHAAGAAEHCPRDPDASVGFDYSSADVRIVRGFRDRVGRTLVALRLDPRRNGCDGVVGEEWSTYWFLVTEGVRSLGANLELVDAGDYDGDGRSELLFWYGGVNEDGYTLVAGGLAQRVDFRWSYH